MAVSQFEAELNLLLFNRPTRKAIPTTAAKALEPQARKVASQWLVAVASPDHPAAAGKRSPLGEEQRVDVRQIGVATGGPSDADPRVVLSRQIWLRDRYLATLDLVQQGLDWAYRPQPLVQPLITSGALTEVVFDSLCRVSLVVFDE